METNQDNDQFLEENITVPEEKNPKLILTISAIAFDFNFDEPRVLLVKNKKPSRKSKEGKPGGFGLPTGQLESKEDMIQALKRETRDESGCSVTRVIGKLFIINKRLTIDGNPVPNEIHVFLVEASEPLSRIREVDEIDGTVEPWVPLRQVFEMPMAQDKSQGGRNPNGIYFSHLKRLYTAIESMVYNPEELLEGEAIKKWLEPNRRALYSAMTDLRNSGLLENFLPPDDEIQEEEVSV